VCADWALSHIASQLEVYATGAAGTLEEDSYSKSSGWAWQSLGGSFTAP